MRTCRTDAKGEVSSGHNREDESTDAEHRGGVLWAPKRTPPDIVAKLNGAVVAALASPRVRERFAEIVQEIPPREQQMPEALGALQKAEIEKWWPIIKAAHIKVD